MSSSESGHSVNARQPAGPLLALWITYMRVTTPRHWHAVLTNGHYYAISPPPSPTACPIDRPTGEWWKCRTSRRGASWDSQDVRKRGQHFPSPGLSGAFRIVPERRAFPHLSPLAISTPYCFLSFYSFSCWILQKLKHTLIASNVLFSTYLLHVYFAWPCRSQIPLPFALSYISKFQGSLWKFWTCLVELSIKVLKPMLIQCSVQSLQEAKVQFLPLVACLLLTILLAPHKLVASWYISEISSA